MKRKQLAAVKPIRPAILRKASVETLDEIVSDVHAGKITAFAIVAKADGYLRWFSWSGRSTADCMNIVGQLECLKTVIIEEANG